MTNQRRNMAGQAPSPWQPTVDEGLRSKLVEISLEVAHRLSDSQRTAALARQAAIQSRLPVESFWTPWDVAAGPASVALLFGQLDECFPNQGWDYLAHNYVKEIVQGIERSSDFPIPLGLINGVSGICFTLSLLSKNGNSYKNAMYVLDQFLTSRLSADHRLLDSSISGIATRDFDVVHGLSGIGSYLLLRLDVARTNDILCRIVDNLVKLSLGQAGWLGFFTPASLLPTEHHRKWFPNGCIDCGLAHGVPGPLAFLSLAYIQGIDRPEKQRAIAMLSEWLINHSFATEWGLDWTYAVIVGGVRSHVSRAAWCYGNPGVACSLWHASESLRNEYVREAARMSLNSIVIRPNDVRRTYSPKICHGKSGLLHIISRFTYRNLIDNLEITTNRLAEGLVAQCDAESAVSFRDIEEDRCIDNPGFLTGAAGVALVALAAATSCEPKWDRLLLVS